MLICASCGRDNPDDAAFCNSCGATLGTPASSREVRKTVTIVFCDLTGSTEFGEQTDPEALRALLARYFERMKAIVEAHGGTVEKFIGDAVMAVFGISTAHEDDALRACRAAVEMRDALPELGIAGRIGVNTGEVVTGTQERLATGDAVNVAARLEQAAVSHDGSDGVMASWRSMLARDLFYSGRFDEVEPLLDAARIAGWHPVERTFVPAVEALLLSRSGAHDQAAERARAAVATAETETDNVWLQGWSNEDLALVLKRAGRVDEAGEALKRALTVWERKRCLPYVRRVREHIESLGRAQA